MNKHLRRFLNVITFGYISRKAKKEAAKLAATKNNELKVGSMDLPNVDALCNALGSKENIIDVTSTISTITFKLNDISKANIDELRKICAKGVMKSNNAITLLIGDCAMNLKNEFTK